MGALRLGKDTFNGLVEKHWFNAIWFQTTWFCAVLGREAWLPLTAALLLVHLALVRDRLAEIQLMALVGGTGIAVDAALSILDIYQFGDGVVLPLWLCALWLAFAAATVRSLSFLAGRPALAALAGAIVIPLNYWAGQRLGAVEFPYPLTTTLLLVSLCWAVMLPVLYRLRTSQPPVSPVGEVL